MPRVIFLFFDGVGIGRADESNPFFTSTVKYIPFFQGYQPPTGNGAVLVKPIDAVLGIDGIPTSASGQTTLFTGINIPKLLNQHKGSYPDKFMRKTLIEGNILLTLRGKDLNARFLNAYPAHRELFSSQHIAIQEDGEFYFSDQFPRLFRRRISVTSCMLLSTLTPPFDEQDVREERSIYQDFSNKSLIDKGLDIPEYTPEKAAEIIYNASRSHDFLLYEFFQTDMHGHNAGYRECEELIRRLDRLVGRLISLLNPEEDTLLLTSDHGNLEDNTTRLHTHNPVPLLVWGSGSHRLRSSIDSIADVTPALLNYFEQQTAVI
jgi:hypothetical protein